MAKNPVNEEGQRIRRFLFRIVISLSSMKITIGTLLWITAMCITATFITQHPSPESYISIKSLLLNLLDFSHMFYSLWFIIPAIILAINIVACMAIWARKTMRSSFIPHMPGECSHEDLLPRGIDMDKACERLSDLLCRGYRMKRTFQVSSWLIYGEKSLLRKYSPLLVHMSILLFLLGACLGLFGFKASIEVPEGEAIDVIKLDNGGIVHLPFKVRCDSFRVDYYENGMPKEYRSDVAFLINNRMVKRSPVLVNHPVSFEGILFSQSGFNNEHLATIAIESGGIVHHAIAGESTFFLLNDKGNRVHVMRMVDNVMNMGPAAQLMVETPEGSRILWIFKDINRVRVRFPGLDKQMPEFNPSLIKPYTFTLEKMENRYTTELGLNKDPGVLFVAIGAILFLAGILINFLIHRNQIWISIKPSGNDFKVKISHMIGNKTCDLGKDTLDHLNSVLGGQA
jgi:cytochrome c biogenesis protein